MLLQSEHALPLGEATCGDGGVGERWGKRGEEGDEEGLYTLQTQQTMGLLHTVYSGRSQSTACGWLSHAQYSKM